MWIELWFLISKLAELFDFAFLVLRPRSLAGGDLAPWFDFHATTLVLLDPRYGMVDGLALCQAYLGVAEAVVALVAVLTLRGRARLFALVRRAIRASATRRPHRHCAAQAMVATFNFAKTLVYFGTDAVLGFPHQDWSDQRMWTLFLLPSTPWLVVPPLIVLHAFNTLTADTAAKLKRK